MTGCPVAVATVRPALALVSPAAEAVIVAVPAVVGVNAEAATPAAGDTGDAGLNEPATPLAEKLIALLAVVTVFPCAS